jgi:hypothetical protein
MTNDKCREGFEAWCLKHEGAPASEFTDDLWVGWFAAWKTLNRATTTPPADTVKPQLNSAKDFNCADMQERARKMVDAIAKTMTARDSKKFIELDDATEIAEAYLLAAKQEGLEMAIKAINDHADDGYDPWETADDVTAQNIKAIRALKDSL